MLNGDGNLLLKQDIKGDDTLLFGSLLLAFFQCFSPTVVAELSSEAFNKQL